MSLKQEKNNRILEKINKGVWMAALAAVIVAMTGLSNHNTLTVRADDDLPAGRKFSCVEWNRVYKESDIKNQDFIGMLQFVEGGNCYYTADSSFSNKKWVCHNINRDPFICDGQEADSFLTSNFEGAPYFSSQGTDGDNGNSPRFKIYFCDFTSKKSNKGLYISTESLSADSSPDKWTFLTQGSTSKRSVGYGWWYIFYNRSWDRDSHLQYSGNVIKAEKSSGWPGHGFILLKGVSKNYAAIADFTVQRNQVLRVANDVFQLDNTTITVEDGAVLSIAGKFLYNGSIDIKGTVIVQKNACMLPYLPSKDSARCGNIILRDGGTLIIMDGAKVIAGIPGGCLGTNTSTNGVFTGLNGNVINFGMFCCGNSYFTKDFVFENHSGARIVLGVGNTRTCGKVFNKYNSSVLKKSVDYFGFSKVGHRMNNPQMPYNSTVEVVDPKGTPTLKAFNGSNFEAFGDTYYFDTYSYDSSGKMTFKEAVSY